MGAAVSLSDQKQLFDQLVKQYDAEIQSSPRREECEHENSHGMLTEHRIEERQSEEEDEDEEGANHDERSESSAKLSSYSKIKSLYSARERSIIENNKRLYLRFHVSYRLWYRGIKLREGVVFAPLTSFEWALEKAFATGRTPLILDSSVDDKVCTFFSYQPDVVMIEAKMMVIEDVANSKKTAQQARRRARGHSNSNGATSAGVSTGAGSNQHLPVVQILEQARRILVNAMKYGKTLVVRLGTSAPNFVHRFNDDCLNFDTTGRGTAFFPLEVFQQAGKPLKAECLRTQDGKGINSQSHACGPGKDGKAVSVDNSNFGIPDITETQEPRERLMLSWADRLFRDEDMKPHKNFAFCRDSFRVCVASQLPLEEIDEFLFGDTTVSDLEYLPSDPEIRQEDINTGFRKYKCSYHNDHHDHHDHHGNDFSVSGGGARCVDDEVDGCRVNESSLLSHRQGNSRGDVMRDAEIAAIRTLQLQLAQQQQKQLQKQQEEEHSTGYQVNQVDNDDKCRQNDHHHTHCTTNTLHLPPQADGPTVSCRDCSSEDSTKPCTEASYGEKRIGLEAEPRCADAAIEQDQSSRTVEGRAGLSISTFGAEAAASGANNDSGADVVGTYAVRSNTAIRTDRDLDIAAHNGYSAAAAAEPPVVGAQLDAVEGIGVGTAGTVTDNDRGIAVTGTQTIDTGDVTFRQSFVGSGYRGALLPKECFQIVCIVTDAPDSDEEDDADEHDDDDDDDGMQQSGKDSRNEIDEEGGVPVRGSLASSHLLHGTGSGFNTRGESLYSNTSKSRSLQQPHFKVGLRK